MCASTVIQLTVWSEWKTKRGTLHTPPPQTPFVAQVRADSWESRFWTFILKKAECLWPDSESFAREATLFFLFFFFPRYLINTFSVLQVMQYKY